MSIKRDVLLLFRPYYLINIILSLSYVIAKRMELICHQLFGEVECELDSRETEILFFLLIVVMFRSRKSGNVTMLNYLSSSFPYTKIANALLWFYADFRLGIVFAVIAILTALLFPELTYNGPDKVVYFEGPSLDEELSHKKNVTWLITFYTAWNPNCINFASTFARLSEDYTLANLKFGKMDIGRFPAAGKKYGVSDSPLSNQLPTVILFQNGKEVDRRPCYDAKRKIQKFIFSEANVKAAFDLNNLYAACKEKKVEGKKALKQE